MPVTFDQFKTPDGLSLPGLLFSPFKSKKAAIYLHGFASSIFYKHDYTLAEKFNEKGISFLYFNNRGADLIKPLTQEKNGVEQRGMYGSSYEIIRECVQDIDGAVSFLKEKGFDDISLIGHSTGANKICVYNYYKPDNDIVNNILLSGGDDTGLYYCQLGEKKFNKLLNKARDKIENKKGEELVKLPGSFLSYQSFFDICNPDGDYNTFPFYEALNNRCLSSLPLFRHYKSIKKNSLVMYGEFDEYVPSGVDKAVNVLKKYQPEFAYKILPGGDHRFLEKQNLLADTILDWLIR